MDRRLLVVPGALVLLLVVVSGGVDVVHWQADLRATDSPTDTHPRTTTRDLPAECHRFARSLAAGRTVSIEGYHAGSGTVDVLARRTSGRGWEFGDANCATRLAFANNLRVGNHSYDVEGHYVASKLHRMPLFRFLQLAGGLFGVGMLVAGVGEIGRRYADERGR